MPLLKTNPKTRTSELSSAASVPFKSVRPPVLIRKLPGMSENRALDIVKATGLRKDLPLVTQTFDLDGVQINVKDLRNLADERPYLPQSNGVVLGPRTRQIFQSRRVVWVRQRIELSRQQIERVARWPQRDFQEERQQVFQTGERIALALRPDALAVLPFDMVVRKPDLELRAMGVYREGGGPDHVIEYAHGDFRHEGAQSDAERLIQTHGRPDLRGLPFEIVTVWRHLPPLAPNTATSKAFPLLILDPQTCRSEDVILDPRPGVGAPELHSFRADQSWLYLSNMGIEDVLVHKQYDSSRPNEYLFHRTAKHTKFNTDMNYMQDRESWEMRLFVWRRPPTPPKPATPKRPTIMSKFFGRKSN